MISKETFVKAMNIIRDFNRQLHHLMDVENLPGHDIMVYSTDSYYMEAVSCIFANAFGMSSSPLEWWLYECFEDKERYVRVGGEIRSVVDPGDFYDTLIQYPDLWENWFTRKDAPHYPLVIDQLAFRKVVALVRQEQKNIAEVTEVVQECGDVFCVYGKPGRYLEAALLLLEDMFNDTKGLLRWYLTQEVDHKIWIEDKMYDINEPDDFYSFIQTKAHALPRKLE